MTLIKLNNDTREVADAIAAHVERIASNAPSPFMAIVEFKPSDETKTYVDGKEDWVRCRVVGMEIARGSQEPLLRDAQRAMFTARTAQGTLDEDDDQLEISQQTLDNVAGLIAGEEVARLRALVGALLDKADAIAADSKLRADDVRLKLGKVVQQSRRVLAGVESAGL